MALSEKSILIVGGGIAGLCLGVVALSRGYSATIVSRDLIGDTASGIAAGMIAPAMEAMGDADPKGAFLRLKAAQTAWLDQFGLWPEPLQRALTDGMSQPALYVWDEDAPTDGGEGGVAPLLTAMGASWQRLDDDQVRIEGFNPGRQSALRIEDDWLVEASIVLAALETAFESAGTIIRDTVTALTGTSVTLAGGDILNARHVVIAAGYGAHAFADAVPSLKALSPIKGHLLDMAGQGGAGVIRSTAGYLANYGATAKFGATMQAGVSDPAIEPDAVAGLKSRAAALMPGISVDPSTPRSGIRAASPDGWPMIGRDKATGVWMATAMRRNGFVFAPYAAGVVLDGIEGKPRADAVAYDPDRFG
ncbi:MAG: NAD(P)/FAD-dependent oxidoreductase [Asticcacaulis sp.]